MTNTHLRLRSPHTPPPGGLVKATRSGEHHGLLDPLYPQVPVLRTRQLALPEPPGRHHRRDQRQLPPLPGLRPGVHEDPGARSPDGLRNHRSAEEASAETHRDLRLSVTAGKRPQSPGDHLAGCQAGTKPAWHSKTFVAAEPSECLGGKTDFGKRVRVRIIASSQKGAVVKIFLASNCHYPHFVSADTKIIVAADEASARELLLAEAKEFAKSVAAHYGRDKHLEQQIKQVARQAKLQEISQSAPNIIEIESSTIRD
ncbi:MAG: hypothetical protein BWY68_00231 [bacterium ADurb.Bin400]|nr:MAG: hypothetical protein BWY68_00231 [bacterium ADurb.Bin400]